MKKIALITGASSGFGSILATKLAKQFKCIDEIYMVARREDKMHEIAKTINKTVKIIPMDLCDESNIDKLANIIKEDGVAIKILANCAGFGIYNDFIEQDYSKCTDMIKLNCLALTEITKQLIPYMSYNSRIINIASAAAFLPQTKFAEYAATKSYVLSFTRALNRELKDLTIKCTAVCPGPADTNFFDIALEQTTDIPFYKHLFMADASKVMDKAIHDSVIGKEVSVYGVSMNLLRFFTKIIPHRIILKFM